MLDNRELKNGAFFKHTAGVVNIQNIALFAAPFIYVFGCQRVKSMCVTKSKRRMISNAHRGYPVFNILNNYFSLNCSEAVKQQCEPV